jgi:hypothetical protein
MKLLGFQMENPEAIELAGKTLAGLRQPAATR